MKGIHSPTIELILFFPTWESKLFEIRMSWLHFFWSKQSAFGKNIWINVKTIAQWSKPPSVRTSGLEMKLLSNQNVDHEIVMPSQTLNHCSFFYLLGERTFLDEHSRGKNHKESRKSFLICQSRRSTLLSEESTLVLQSSILNKFLIWCQQ